MANTIYPIHRGINRPMTFKGLCAQYILYAAALLVSDLVVFVILYISGLSSWICLPLTFATGLGGLAWIYRLSRTYGAFGLLKKRARRRVPGAIVFYSRLPFICLHISGLKER